MLCYLLPLDRLREVRREAEIGDVDGFDLHIVGAGYGTGPLKPDGDLIALDDEFLGIEVRRHRLDRIGDRRNDQPVENLPHGTDCLVEMRRRFLLDAPIRRRDP